MARRRKSKGIAYHVGDVFAMPLSNGRWARGQVVALSGTLPKCALSTRCVDTLENARSWEAEVLSDVIAVLTVSGADLEDGVWPIVGHSPTPYTGPFTEPIGRSYSDTIAPELIAAYVGLSAWEYGFDGKQYDAMLIPGVPPPPHAKGVAFNAHRGT
jgi:hypothetical protein